MNLFPDLPQLCPPDHPDYCGRLPFLPDEVCPELSGFSGGLSSCGDLTPDPTGPATPHPASVEYEAWACVAFGPLPKEQIYSPETLRVMARMEPYELGGAP